MRGWGWAAAGLLWTTMGAANAGSFGVAATVGTLGAGAELSYALSDRFGVRVLGAGFGTSLDVDVESSDDLEYNGDLDLAHGALLVDYHPFAGTFRVSAGVMVNDDGFDGDGGCRQATCDFGDYDDVLVRIDASVS